MAGLLRRAAFRGPLLRSSRLSTTPFLRSSLSTLSSHQADDVIDLTTKAAELNVRMTTAEMDSLLAELDSSGDGLLQRSEVEVVGRAKLEERWTRDVLLAAIEKPRSALDHLGTKLVTSLDYFGTALFACVGVQIAGGEAGMNLVGCTLIGCVAAMGGGTVNNLLYGAAHPDGVFWVRSPSFLFVALTVSVLTFFAWPMYCEHQAAQELKTARDTLKALAKAEEAEGKEKSSRLGKAQLSRRSSVELLETNPDFHQRACQVLGLHPKTTSAYEIFRRMDTDQSGHIELEEMCNLVQRDSTNRHTSTRRTPCRWPPSRSSPSMAPLAAGTIRSLRQPRASPSALVASFATCSAGATWRLAGRATRWRRARARVCTSRCESSR